MEDSDNLGVLPWTVQVTEWNEEQFDDFCMKERERETGLHVQCRATKAPVKSAGSGLGLPRA